jgi:hypothetical protein
LEACSTFHSYVRPFTSTIKKMMILVHCLSTRLVTRLSSTENTFCVMLACIHVSHDRRNHLADFIRRLHPKPSMPSSKCLPLLSCSSFPSPTHCPPLKPHRTCTPMTRRLGIKCTSFAKTAANPIQISLAHRSQRLLQPRFNLISFDRSGAPRERQDRGLAGAQ